jgi:4-hydroxymandelate oxidase
MGCRAGRGISRERRGALDHRADSFGRWRRAFDPPEPRVAQSSQLCEGAPALSGIEALRERARAVLDAETWQYLEAGTDDGVSVEGAADAWQRLHLHPSILRGVTETNVATKVLGLSISLPIMIAPSGRATRYCADGELALLRGAQTAGTLVVLPSSVIPSLGSLRARSPNQPVWQQLYMARDREVMRGMLGTIRDAGASAVVLTVDLIPDGRAAPPPPKPAPWERPLAEASLPALYSGASIDDLAWLCREAGLPVLVKGVLRGDDACMCVEAGAAGLIVSNHGGNQLDTAVNVVDALPAVVAGAAGQAEIYVDGGIRRGTSVLKALALGARAVLVGRPASYGLAAAGADGVAAMISLLGAELQRSMMLCGVHSVAEVEPSLVGRSI